MAFDGDGPNPEDPSPGDEPRLESAENDDDTEYGDAKHKVGQRPPDPESLTSDSGRASTSDSPRASDSDRTADEDSDEDRDQDDDEDERRYFVTLPVGPDVGLAEVVAAAQEIDHSQRAWHPGMSHSQTAAVLGATAPGASLAAALDRAVDEDESDRDQATRIELVAACDRMMAYLAGVQARFAGEFLTQRGASSGALTATHDEIAARLAITSYAAGSIICRADALADSPRLRQALEGGEVSARKVDVITAAMLGLARREQLVIEDYGLELAPTHTPPQLKKALEAAVIAADPSKAKERHEKEVKERCVTFEPAPHGMAWLSAYLPAEDALSIYTCLDGLAAKHAADDERCIHARRADALTQVFTTMLANGTMLDGSSLPSHHGQLPHLHLSITAPVLAGDEHTPALLHGYGPIDADHARSLAARTRTGQTGADRTGTDRSGTDRTGTHQTARSPEGSSFFKPAEADTVPTSAAHSPERAGAACAYERSSTTSAPPDRAPSTTAPSSTARSNSAPANSVPADRAPSSTVPAETGPAGSTVPADSAPASSTATEPAQGRDLDGLDLTNTVPGPCPVGPGVMVSLGAHPGATWSERCDLLERLGDDATADEVDAILGRADPWHDHRSRREDEEIWRQLLTTRTSPRHSPGSPAEPDPRPDRDGRQPQPHSVGSGPSDPDQEWAWMCRYLPRLDPMWGLIPPPRPPELPDGTDARQLTAWAREHQSSCAAIENQLGLICTDAYSPSLRLRTRVIERDQTCRFPTCQVPAWRCQLDHIVPFDPAQPAWAQTVETNLHALCAHHHQIKTAGIFTVERDPRTGITTWHAPTGHVYARAPEHSDFTALGHHLRDDYAMTIYEDDPVVILGDGDLSAGAPVDAPRDPDVHRWLPESTAPPAVQRAKVDRAAGSTPSGWPAEPPF